MQKANFFIVLGLLFGLESAAQSPTLVLEPGVAPHPGLDSVYHAFNTAYRALNAEQVVQLYTDDAAYLPPDSPILRGHQQIRPSFRNFFEWVAQQGRTMTISFRIVQRKIAGSMAYDVGQYTIQQYQNGQPAAASGGKFVVVAIKGAAGKWRFQVDGYSDMKPARP